jgi:hypothetical protein
LRLVPARHDPHIISPMWNAALSLGAHFQLFAGDYVAARPLSCP